MPTVEKEFNNLVEWYDKHHLRKTKRSGHQKVLQLMLDRPSKIWWWSYEFVGKVNSNGDFLSHRAPARASDLAIHYPHLVEDRRIGRLSVYRLKAENMKEIIEFLEL